MLKLVPARPHEFGDLNLTISHARRRSLNDRVQNWRVSGERPRYIMLKGEQTMLLWRGVPLIAVLNELSKHGIYTSQMLVTIAVDDYVHLRCAEGGQEYAVSHLWAQANLRLGYAVCYASIQSRTCHGTVALWDTKHPMYSRRHLVMGLSRSTALERVWLAD